MLRFAPSPTGDMHIGNLRAAIFNYIVAKQQNKPFLIRIEDTDKERNIEGKDQEILEILKLMGICFDKLIYQSHNLNYHRDMAEKLLKENKAFLCYASTEFLEKEKEKAKNEKRPFRYLDEWATLEKGKHNNPVVRLKAPQNAMSFNDVIKKEVKFEPYELDSFVLLRKDKSPTYNFACACDDLLYEISFIIRGEDHVSNTPKQILIQQALGSTNPITYAHLPIILDEISGKKMSKRDEASSVKWLLKQGFLPTAIVNYLITIGNKVPKEVFTLEEAIVWFNLESLSNSPAHFNLKYLKHLNHEHLKLLDDEKLLELTQIKDISLLGLLRLFVEESDTLLELKEKISLFLEPKDIVRTYENEDFKERCLVLFNALKTMDFQAYSDFESFKKDSMNLSELKGKDFFKPLRILLTGNSHGIELPLIFPYIQSHYKEILRLKA
ncbi:glutamate--tRNA ligase [Helicobacter cetorum]|uniref:Glutamate--tRNA ligase n=1 Tax=Helicobacter cetorum (strain ATCC BAA-540 / CCUG 52418 / MIT 99-5656) TaxID=1163745 RepID=I0ETT6_HELCM|nr:glutamate--tRNA ligase [Helicobacter cetorum]AFI06355.1 glutamylglutaminyl-tRNA synthetase [Helicobacter cetorum MIT 99-5656]